MLPVNSLRFITSDSAKELPPLTKRKIRLLEQTDWLGPVEKVRLLAILASKRWLTDLENTLPSDLIQLSKLLNKLGLTWKTDSYTKRDGSVVTWIQVGANQAVLDYVRQNRKRMSVMEAGLLYGYPTTAILGCASLLTDKYKSANRKSPAERVLGGVYSKQFERLESSSIELMWRELAVISPAIVDQAAQTKADPCEG